MSQSTMCLKCFEPVQKGWQQKHHMRQCTGRPDATNFTQAKQKLEPTKADQPNRELFEVNAAGDNDLADIDENMHQGATLPAKEVGRQRAKGKLRVFLSPKTSEILEFLGTAELGEGCSREHAQGWLNYQKKKGGPSAQLLPKDIRTCWKHVAEVNSALALP
jgi:hypothetical protein